MEKNWEGGQVVAAFKLHADGTISDIKVIKSTVGPEYVSACEKAISTSFPYKPWSEEMRNKSQKESGRDDRDVTFTFNYDLDR